MIRSGLCLAAAALTVLASTSAASAKEFNLRSIKGTWALSVDGFAAENATAFAPRTPLFAIGRVIFRGDGTCESDDQVVAGGFVVLDDPANQDDPTARRVATLCEYEVQPDGYGVFFVTFKNPDGQGTTVTTARFIIETPKRISFIADNAALGIYGGGTMVRQSASIR